MTNMNNCKIIRHQKFKIIKTVINRNHINLYVRQEKWLPKSMRYATILLCTQIVL